MVQTEPCTKEAAGEAKYKHKLTKGLLEISNKLKLVLLTTFVDL